MRKFRDILCVETCSGLFLTYSLFVRSYHLRSLTLFKPSFGKYPHSSLFPFKKNRKVQILTVKHEICYALLPDSVKVWIASKMENRLQESQLFGLQVVLYQFRLPWVVQIRMREWLWIGKDAGNDLACFNHISKSTLWGGVSKLA
jgi:hypothetical protein